MVEEGRLGGAEGKSKHLHLNDILPGILRDEKKRSKKFGDNLTQDMKLHTIARLVTICHHSFVYLFSNIWFLSNCFHLLIKMASSWNSTAHF